MTFDVYGPDNATCTGQTRFSSTNPVNAAGTSAVSDVFTPTAIGAYRVIATYSGDANYTSATTSCDDALERVAVSNSPPPPPPGPPPPPPGTPPPPATPPPPPPPGNYPCVPPPGPVPANAPAGTELCARGTAAIKGKTGCVGTPFKVVVSGRQIQRVVFTLDGKVIKTLVRPNSGTRYALPVSPARLRNGVHRVLARTTFRSASGTKPRTLRVTFSRCARRAVSPAFTG